MFGGRVDPQTTILRRNQRRGHGSGLLAENLWPQWGGSSIRNRRMSDTIKICWHCETPEMCRRYRGCKDAKSECVPDSLHPSCSADHQETSQHDEPPHSAERRLADIEKTLRSEERFWNMRKNESVTRSARYWICEGRITQIEETLLWFDLCFDQPAAVATSEARGGRRNVLEMPVRYGSAISLEE